MFAHADGVRSRRTLTLKVDRFAQRFTLTCMIHLLVHVGYACLVLGALLCLGSQEPLEVAAEVDVLPAGS